MQHSTQHIENKRPYFNGDILIVGTGPAGLIASIHCATEGFSVAIISEHIAKPWTNNYCFWKSELDALQCSKPIRDLFENSIEKSWPSASVHLSTHNQVEIDAEFAKFNTRKLQQQLLDHAKELGVQFFEGTIANITHTKTESIATTNENIKYRSRVVIAANGTTSTFLNISKTPTPAFQIAYGQMLDVSNKETPWKMNTMEFMDFRAAPRYRRTFDNPPSFLYVLPMSSTRVFVEETVLATRKTVPWEMLKERLDLRKELFGLTKAPVLDEEYCRIQMGGALPVFGRTLAFGAAAGFTHPVTGFQILRSLHTAPRLASHLKSHWNESTEDLSQGAWKSIWTNTELHNRKLYLLGLDMVTRFSFHETQSFFEAFFKSSPESRANFLSGMGSKKSVHVNMWQTFQHANWATKARIVQRSAQHPSSLFSALMGTLTTVEN